MASFASENFPCINGDDFMNGGDVLKLDSVFLMSLLEESQGEEYNDEQLENLIRSLEAEINPETIMEDQDSVMEHRLLISNDVDGQDYSESWHSLHDFAWNDMELVASSPLSDDDFNLYMDSYNQMDGIAEFGGVSDDHSQLYNGCYSSLWHETDDIMTC